MLRCSKDDFHLTGVFYLQVAEVKWTLQRLLLFLHQASLVSVPHRVHLQTLSPTNFTKITVTCYAKLLTLLLLTNFSIFFSFLSLKDELSVSA